MTLFFVLALLITVPAVFLIGWRRKTRPKHPPGPVALPVIGHLHLIGPLLHQSLSRLASRYGPLMYLRVGSHPILVVSSPEVAGSIFKNHDTAFSKRRHNTATMRFTYGGLAFGFSPYGPYWTFIKRLAMAELLGSKALHRLLPLRNAELHHLIGALLEKSKAQEGVDLSKELLKMTGNNISMMMISKRCGATAGEADEFAALVCGVTQMAVEMDFSEIGLLFCSSSGFRKRVEDIFRRFDALVEKIVTDREHLRSKTNRKVNDFLDILLDLVDGESSYEPEVQITRVHVKALVLDFFVAATDTTAIAVEWALVELIRHPEIMKKAQDEVDQVVGKSRIVEKSDIERLPYIQAVIKETFRLHPPLPLVARESAQECTIDGFTIPSGVTLFVNVWAMGRDPKVWDSPTEFQPERFLPGGSSDGSSIVDVTGHHYQLLPFGAGRRRCPAVNLALQGITATLAALLQCFDWEVAGGASLIDMTERPGLVVPRAHHLNCFPIARFTPKLV